MNTSHNYPDLSGHMPPLPPLSPSRPPVLLNTLLVIGLFGLAVFLIPMLISYHTVSSTGLVHWRNTYETAARETKTSGKPILLYFSADWCAPCREMKSNVWSDSTLADFLNSRFIPVQVDVDVNPDLARQFSVVGIPTITFIRNGKTVYNQSGYHSSTDLMAVMQANGG